MRGTSRQVTAATHIEAGFGCRGRLPIAIGERVVRGTRLSILKRRENGRASVVRS
jgi:hypothetical protein